MKEPFGKYACEPIWHPVVRLRRGFVAAPWRDWLLDGSSLTRRLIAICGGDFQVEVTRQKWERPMRNEARALTIASDQHALVREVRLLCDGVPWVFARTVIPLATLRGRQKRLRYLGEKPLGAYLFADPRMRRASLEVAHIEPGQILFRRAASGSKAESIWGRRSLFLLSNKPLLVSEIFLPILLEHYQ